MGREKAGEPIGESLSDKAWKLVKEQKFAEAIPLLHQLSNSWSDVEFPEALANAYIQTREYKKAIDASFKALGTPDGGLYAAIRKDVYTQLQQAYQLAGHEDCARLCGEIAGHLGTYGDTAIPYDETLSSMEGRLFEMNLSLRQRTPAAAPETLQLT